MRAVFYLTLILLISPLVNGQTERDGIRDLINSANLETRQADVPDGIKRLIEESEAIEAQIPKAEDNRPRFCMNSRGTFYNPVACQRKKLPLLYCKYGGCGSDLCSNPKTSCAKRYAASNNIKATSAQDSDLSLNDQREIYKISEGACDSNVFIGDPLSGYGANSSFGWRRDPFTKKKKKHSGSDFRAPSGVPIRASAPGVMICPAGRGYGRAIKIRHASGVETRYAHMSYYRTAGGKKSKSTKACNGRKVQRGDIIGYVGSTGRSTGPHLHFEVRCGSIAVDPKKYIGRITHVAIPTLRPDPNPATDYESEVDQPMDGADYGDDEGSEE